MPNRTETIPRVAFLIPTYKRAKSLSQVLYAMGKMHVPNGTDWEIIVVDNAGCQQTQAICRKTRLPLRLLIYLEEGKNRALNFGLKHIDAELVVFFDDDVLPAQDYLKQLCLALQIWPDAPVFGGRVEPLWPSEYCEIHPKVLTFALDWAYACYSSKASEEKHDYVPFENNMIIRRHVIKGEDPFDPDTGPLPGKYRMGTGYSFFKKVLTQGQHAIYLPNVLVKHIIRPDQMTYCWLRKRAKNYGRSIAHHGYSFYGIRGQASLIEWAYQCLVYASREYFQLIKGNEYGRRFMQLLRHITYGCIYEKMNNW